MWGSCAGGHRGVLSFGHFFGREGLLDESLWSRDPHLLEKRGDTFQENTCILTFCMYFKRIPNESKIHFGIHIRYIKIHVSWALPWCHTGYMSRYIRICVSWTLHHDTSGYTEIQNHDTCILDGIHAGYNLKRIPRMYPVRYVTEMQDTCKIHSRYIWDTCICRGDQATCGTYAGHLKFT